MPDLAQSTIDRAHSDIESLRRGLSDLAQWLTSRQTGIRQAQETQRRIALLGECLEHLSANLDQQEKELAQRCSRSAAPSTLRLIWKKC
jgi:hypothetical protein